MICFVKQKVMNYFLCFAPRGSTVKEKGVGDKMPDLC